MKLTIQKGRQISQKKDISTGCIDKNRSKGAWEITDIDNYLFQEIILNNISLYIYIYIYIECWFLTMLYDILRTLLWFQWNTKEDYFPEILV